MIYADYTAVEIPENHTSHPWNSRFHCLSWKLWLAALPDMVALDFVTPTNAVASVAISRTSRDKRMHHSRAKGSGVFFSKFSVKYESWGPLRWSFACFVSLVCGCPSLKDIVAVQKLQ